MGSLKAFEIILYVGLAQGIFLIFSITSIKRNNLKANQYLVGLVVFTTLSILGQLMLGTSSSWFKIMGSFLQVALLFLFGPLLLHYAKSLLFTEKQSFNQLVWLPKLAHVLLSVLLLFEWPIQNQSIAQFWILVSIEGLAILHVFYFTLKTYHVLERYKALVQQEKSSLPSIGYLSTVVTFKIACLLFWTYAFTHRLVFPVSCYNKLFYAVVWLVPTLLIFALGFYAIRAPEIFRVAEPKKKDIHKASLDLTMLYQRLTALMETDKPYLNPEISIAQLAEKVGLNVQDLSVTITEKSGYNFFDFINSYRIKEFLALANNPKHNHLTLLAIALDAGFNSKTAFNNAFKRITGSTPTQYLKKTKPASTVRIEGSR